jgi:uncharacterized membrane protein YqjE
MYAVFVLILSWIKQKKPGWMHLSYLAGTVIGAVIMFTNGAYRRAASTPNSYKHIGFSVRTMYEQFSTTIMENLFLNNRVLNLLFAVVLIGLLIHRGKKRFTGFAACVLCGFSFYSIWMLICPGWIFAGNEMLNSLIQTLLCILYFLTVLFVIWETVSKEVRYSVCVLYLSAAVVTAPLLAASPIGPRCFYISYILECMALLKLVQYLFDEKNIDCYYPTVILSVLALLIGIVYVRMFSMIGAADQSRAAIIEAAVNNGETEITLPVLPYAGYYWTTIPQTEEWEVYFKQFYGIPQEVKLNFE